MITVTTAFICGATASGLAISQRYVTGWLAVELVKIVHLGLICCPTGDARNEVAAAVDRDRHTFGSDSRDVASISNEVLIMPITFKETLLWMSALG
jgi:hypothetical protein